jgi:hypothetical protein
VTQAVHLTIVLVNLGQIDQSTQDLPLQTGAQMEIGLCQPS